MVPGYRLQGLIAQGSFGRVYAAWDVEGKRRVAVKWPRSPAAEEAERLRREGGLLAQLDHRHIVRGYRLLETSDRPILIMEHLAGPPLSSVRSSGPLGAGQIVRIGSQIASALEHAHGRGVIHLDVKSDNILLVDRGAVLIDFGLAVSPRDPDRRASSGLLGTPTYMAPELLWGDSAEADHRADLYSLGVVLYEMATGRAPFSARNLAELSLRVGYDDPAPPPVLQEAILRCLRKRPEERFSSAAELAEALATD